MKKNFLLFLVALLSNLSLLAWAHEDHNHSLPASLKKAKSLSLEAVAAYSKVDAKLGFGQLPSSWAGLPDSAAKVHTNGEGYYIVAVTNAAIKESNKRTLYVLVPLFGDVKTANYSGKFDTLPSLPVYKKPLLN